MAQDADPANWARETATAAVLRIVVADTSAPATKTEVIQVCVGENALRRGDHRLRAVEYRCAGALVAGPAGRTADATGAAVFGIDREVGAFLTAAGTEIAVIDATRAVRFRPTGLANAKPLEI
jgi:hypothetical protein